MEPFWRMIYRGMPIRLCLNDLSNQRMREMKVRFGPAYGIPAEFISLLLRGDMDAIACAIWIGQQKAGAKVEDPTEMDFSLEHLERLEDPEPEEEGDKKGKRPTKGKAPASTSTSTSESSSTDGSSTSETSSD